MKKYNFSEVKRFEDYSYNRAYGLVGKYGCQIFDNQGNYIKCLIPNSYKEVIELQKQFLKEV